MKKKIALALAAVMSMSALAVNVSAEDYTTATLLIEGQAVETDQPAIIVDGRTMVPVRVVAEALGTTVDWDGETKTVIFEQNGLTASMVVGETVLNISDGEITYPVEIDTPAAIINERTMVPIRFLSENFGFTVDWDGETKTVNVSAAAPVLEEVESGAAVEVEEVETEETEAEESAEELTPAEAIQKEVNELNRYCTIINAAPVTMTETQTQAYKADSDKLATVGAVLGTTDMDDEAEFAAANETLASVREGIVKLAEDLGISLDAE